MIFLPNVIDSFSARQIYVLHFSVSALEEPRMLHSEEGVQKACCFHFGCYTEVFDKVFISF